MSIERRDSPRLSFASEIMFQDYYKHTWHEGDLHDYSEGGMAFETDTPLQIGTELFITLDRSPYKTSRDVLRATVVWLKKEAYPQALYPYSVGVKYY